MKIIMTIGHSTRTADAFLELLKKHHVAGVADVRSIPRSRRHPQFSRESLTAFLPGHGIAYVHLASLGGLRTPASDSPNGGWRHSGFRGYADHMQTLQFNQGIDELLSFAAKRLVAIMCAEAKWSQCHRQLIADALTARGIEVRHILSRGDTPVHRLTRFGRVDGSAVTYPALV